MYLIDTNVFLELFLDQEKSDKAGEIFRKIEQGEIRAVLSGFALHSIEYILSLKDRTDILREFLFAISSFKNLSIYFTSVEEDLEILDIMEDSPLDFDDANQYFVAKKFGAEIITFDKDFKKITDLSVTFLS
ncbi:MAG: type II toxin-antitoxin system VapC family toxin [Candidatus Aminicenantes bacterium]|nr:type II toxin-antitoxin system VapC family toxin [Candidatus Aminicenantes bacterium]